MARPRAARPRAAPLFGDPVSAASDSTVDRVYSQLRSMAIGYEFKPGEKLNEVALARRLAVSRPPLREAPNRLAIEGLRSFQPGKGFFCRDQIGRASRRERGCQEVW